MPSPRPAGLPAPLLARLQAEMQRAHAADEVKQRLAGAGGELLPGPPELIATLLASERSRCEKLIREARILPECCRGSIASAG